MGFRERRKGNQAPLIFNNKIFKQNKIIFGSVKLYTTFVLTKQQSNMKGLYYKKDVVATINPLDLIAFFKYVATDCNAVLTDNLNIKAHRYMDCEEHNTMCTVEIDYQIFGEREMSETLTIYRAKNFTCSNISSAPSKG